MVLQGERKHCELLTKPVGQSVSQSWQLKARRYIKLVLRSSKLQLTCQKPVPFYSVRINYYNGQSGR